MLKLLIICCLLFSIGSAHDNQRTVESIVISPFELGSVVTFTLSDNSTWKKLVLVEQEHYLHDIENHLQVGDEVTVTEKKHSKQFCLQKLKNRSIVVGMTKETKTQLPTIERIEEIMVKAAGWFSGSKFEYLVHLSDGSVWKRSCGLFAKYWKEKDALLISTDRDGKDYLIDVDAEHYDPKLDDDRFDKRGWHFECVKNK